jgi:hypothetical protein
MHEALRILSEWYWRFEDQKLDFASEWRTRWETEPEAWALNEARRRVSQFFGAIVDLYNARLLSEPVARRLRSKLFRRSGVRRCRTYGERVGGLQIQQIAI